MAVWRWVARRFFPSMPDKVPPGVQAVLGAMRPMLAGMLGQLGQSIELVVYPATVGRPSAGRSAEARNLPVHAL